MQIIKGISRPEQAMPCFRDFDRTNFACNYSCAYKTECALQTPREVDIRGAIRTLQEMPGADDVDVNDVDVNDVDVKEEVPDKRREPPKSRFDVIDISEEEERKDE